MLDHDGTISVGIVPDKILFATANLTKFVQRENVVGIIPLSLFLDKSSFANPVNKPMLGLIDPEIVLFDSKIEVTVRNDFEGDDGAIVVGTAAG